MKRTQIKRAHILLMATVLLFAVALLFGAPATIEARASNPHAPAGGTVPPPPGPHGWLLRDIVQLANGESHTCALRADARVLCWGSLTLLGDGGHGWFHDLPMVVPLPAGGVKHLSSNGLHTCVATLDGAAYCWGANDSGQIGDGTTNDAGMPKKVVGIADAVESISAGDGHSCAVLVTGAVLCWGKNDAGQLGDGTTTDRMTPVRVTGLSDAVAVEAGRWHSCAIRADGSAVCWGGNYSGELGDGTTTNRLSPVAVVGLSGVTAITLGSNSTCALDTSGKAWCWGGNGAGTLGDGTGVDSATPVGVYGLTSGVRDIEAGNSHVCAVTSTGAVQCWGSNEGSATGIETPGPWPPFSRCSDGGLIPAEGEGGYPAWYFCKPHTTHGMESGSVKVSAGYYTGCALLEESTVKCWGTRADGTIENPWFPSYIMGAEVVAHLGLVQQ